MKIRGKNQQIFLKSPSQLEEEYSIYLEGDAWWSEKFFEALNQSLELVLRRILKPGSVAIDIGANRGRFLSVMQDVVGREGKALGVEPNKFLAEHLERVGLDSLEVAISAESNSSQVVFQVPKYGEGSDEIGSIAPDYLEKYFGLSEGSCDSYLVDTLTLDQILEPFSRINILKVDAEGLDTEILKSSKNIHKKVDAIVWEHNMKIDAQSAGELHNNLQESNFKIYDAFFNELSIDTCLNPWVSPINRYALKIDAFNPDQLKDLEISLGNFWQGYQFKSKT